MNDNDASKSPQAVPVMFVEDGLATTLTLGVTLKGYVGFAIQQNDNNLTAFAKLSPKDARKLWADLGETLDLLEAGKTPLEVLALSKEKQT